LPSQHWCLDAEFHLALALKESDDQNASPFFRRFVLTLYLRTVLKMDWQGRSATLLHLK
jgi:hypothetical protein